MKALLQAYVVRCRTMPLYDRITSLRKNLFIAISCNYVPKDDIAVYVETKFLPLLFLQFHVQTTHGATENNWRRKRKEGH